MYAGPFPLSLSLLLFHLFPKPNGLVTGLIFDMPLQKPSLQSRHSPDKPALISRQLAQDRRPTLQTVSELSSQNPTSSEWTTEASTMISSEGPDGNNNQSSWSLTNGTDMARDISEISGSERRGRPKTIGFAQPSQTRPLILITAADTPPLRRSLTTPMDWTQQEADSSGDQVKATDSDNSHRLSVNFSLRSNFFKDHQSHTETIQKRNSLPGQSMFQVDQRQTRRPSGHHSENMESCQDGSRASKEKQPVRDQTPVSRPSAFSVTPPEKREMERIRREQAVVEARARREKEGRGIAMGSSSTLPSLSPLSPVARPSQAHLKSRISQHQLLQNSRTMNSKPSPGHLNRRASAGYVSGQVDKRMSNDVNARLLKRASTNSTDFEKRQYMTNRASGGSFNNPSSNPSRPKSLDSKRTSQRLSQPFPMLTLTESSTSLSFTSPHSPTHYLFPRPPSGVLSTDRRSRSLHLSHQSIIRTSSVHSTTSHKSAKSNTSSKSHQSRRSSKTSYSSQSRRHQRGVTKEHLDALAALTAPAPTPDARMTPESLAFLESQKKKLEEKIRRESVGSERAMRKLLVRERSRSRSRSRAGSRTSLHSYATERSKGYNASISGVGTGNKDLEGLTPESIRLLREREKLLRWKAEREKQEFEKQEREKIRERVRRANEMEEARSKSMVKEKKRGCCGILRM
ncbi:hypothetical protein K469DRAFT_392485 [Zopfia rhizophila CBS 207.26]|uniref:TPX2 C-terminal domain-containing protein n=1 Tax=Zopfia rhizophila CBS 207.26 TaxID=1314779 RepID=A0A6A6ELK1_9PEZI|nr:hypothetical protein K469DRAFT_392485 [Zopfia rhizophila CBS 207.26]